MARSPVDAAKEIVCGVEFAAVGGSLEKTDILAKHFKALRRSAEDRYLTARLLLPGKNHDQRVYQLKDKSLLALLSSVLRCSEAAMTYHLEQDSENTDAGRTAEHFYRVSTSAPPQPPPYAPLTLGDVNDWLDRLAVPSADASGLFASFVPRCTPDQLRVVTRIVRKDLRINAGSAVVLKAVGGEAAYERFKGGPQELRAICGAGIGGGGGSGAGTSAAGAGSSANGSSSGGIINAGIRAGVHFKPMLAEQCKSFDQPVSKYPKGFLVEVKYDGERLQVHKKASGEVRFFARGGKPTAEHKVTGLIAALETAFPGDGREYVLDGETVMRDADGTVLPFGAQGKHEQEKYPNATCCLLVFDLLLLDGKDLSQRTQKERRSTLEAELVQVPRHVELSNCRFMRTAAEIRGAFAECAKFRLEGLMIKDIRAPYVLDSRKYWMKCVPQVPSNSGVSSFACLHSHSRTLLCSPFRSCSTQAQARLPERE